MHIALSAAALPSLSASPAPARAPGPREESRPFAEVLRQNQPPKPPQAPQQAQPAQPQKQPASAEHGAPDGERNAAEEPPTGPAPAPARGAGDAAEESAGGASDPPGVPSAKTAAPEADLAIASAVDPRAEPAADARKARWLHPGLGGGPKRGAAAPASDAVDARHKVTLLQGPVEKDAATDASALGHGPLDPGLARFVADLHLGAALPPALEGDAPAGATLLTAAASRPDARPEAPPLPPHLAGQAASGANAAAGPTESATVFQAALALRTEQPAAPAAELLRAAVTAAEPRADSAREGPAPAAAWFGAALAPAGAGLSVPSAGAVIAAPGTADFAQTLGVQVSLLAKEGVQRARLHLNAAEMGAVSVQIVMDGTQAQVDFGADMAATRDAIEAGLPELASALRDAGLTLSGGDVSKHSRGRGEGEGGSASNDRAAAAERAAATEAAPPLRRLVSETGGVDLYA